VPTIMPTNPEVPNVPTISATRGSGAWREM
jgi:hypothetical protein